MKQSDVYLGDGLYASFDGYQFVLRAPRQDGDHWVALEPGVLQVFMAFVTEQAEQKVKEIKNETV